MLLLSPAIFEDGAFSTISKAKILNDDPLPSTPLAAGHPFHTISGLRNAHATPHLGNVGRRGFGFELYWRFQGPTTGTGGLRFRFRVYSALQTKKAIEKEGGRVSKCVHPDTTVILANWILLDCTLCNRGDDFLVSPQVAFTQISSVQG